MRTAGAIAIAAAMLVPVTAASGQFFVNFETPHVSPLDMTPDGSRLLAVNTPDNRLEVFAITAGGIAPLGAVGVGLEPVSVRARTDDEAWVVNHLSDSISVIDLNAMRVVATINTGDEPADVVFAGAPSRAFVTLSQLNQVRVYDPLDLAAAPVTIAIAGEDPRALATDGTRVYAAIFESGNRTTIIGETVVASTVNPYAGDPNPPPNAGAAFDPPIAPGLPAPPDASLILKKDAGGAWRDDNGGNWSPAVTWDLHDHDVAVIDAASLSVSYVTGLMNANMALSVRPGGQVVVVGTDATNEIRFEPNIKGTFVRVIGAAFTAPSPGASARLDLNPHLTYASATIPQGQRDLSLGDPRGVAWRADGTTGFISGMGSNNVVVVSGALARLSQIEVGEGPTGLRVDETNDRLYVLNKFEASISLVDLGTLAEIGRVAFYDPTPAVIRAGRPHLYDTHQTSGLGQASCASCHIDARMDQLAWDLGDPQGAIKPFDQICNFDIPPANQFCEDWHPMKGPMATQTLVGIIGSEPLHWRGDRGGLDQFNPAFEALMGDDAQLTPQEMAEFEAFLETIVPVPNPNRNTDHTLKTSLPNGGNPQVGFNLYQTIAFDGGLLTCVQCHAFPTGTNGQITSGNALMEAQSMKIPQLRNMNEKTGFFTTSMSNNKGFGFIHDGSVDTLFSFLQAPVFNFTSNQQRRDIEAFLLSFTMETHAGIGVQATIGGAGPDEIARRNQLHAIADAGGAGLVVRGMIDGEMRGAFLVFPDEFQSDRAAQTFTTAQLDFAAATEGAIVYTLVPGGSQWRIGVDRDEDGYFDRDELDVCADPADPASTPLNSGGCGGVPGDATGDGLVNVDDLIAVILGWGTCAAPPAPCPADVTGDGLINVDDLIEVIVNWS